MKIKLLLIVLFCKGVFANAQNSRVGINLAQPTASLHVGGTTGIEPLRVENLTNSDLTSGDGTYDTNIMIVKNGQSTNSEDIGVVKTAKAVMPVFFYSPPINLPIYSDQGHLLATRQSVNLYDEYRSQFGSSSAVLTPTSTSLSSEAVNKLPLFAANDLIYHVTYFDNTVFKNLSITTAGVLSYDIDPLAVITDKTYMTIIFEVKNN